MAANWEPNETDTTNDPPREQESAFRRWERHHSTIFGMFNEPQSLGMLTRCSVSSGLIPTALHQSVTDKTKLYNSTERATKLVQYLDRKALTEKSTEGKVFKQFLECLANDEFYKTIRENLEKEYRMLCKSSTNASAQVFQKHTDMLVDVLAGDLTSLAMNLRSKGVLTEEEYNSVTNSEAYHTSECLNNVLKQIGLQIKLEPAKLNIFIGILEKESPGFYSGLIKSLKGNEC